MKVSEFRKLIREEVRKVINESTPKAGQTINDWDLVDRNIIKSADEEPWLELLTEFPNNWVRIAPQKSKVLQLVNGWLKKRGYQWSVADALSQDEEGVVTWKIA